MGTNGRTTGGPMSGCFAGVAMFVALVTVVIAAIAVAVS